MVGGRMIDKEGKSKYLYQTRFAEAACVSANDTQEQAYSKIRYVWDNNENLLKCTSGAFDVARGGLLKYAFSGEFDDFIDDAIRWQVNLNSIDESDQRTVLDYFTYYIDKNKGNALEQRYRNYYDKLRSAGAKHRVELK